MEANFYPRVGMSGSFKVNSPFDTVVSSQVVYQVLAIENIQGMVSRGYDVYEEIYEPLGVDKALYEQDLEEDTVILTLKDSLGNNVLCPNSYILELPDADGIIYGLFALAISLEAIPLSMDLTPLKEEITEIVKSKMGVHSTVTEMEYAENVLLTHEQHTLIEAKRRANLSKSSSLLQANRDLTTENERLRTQMKALEDYILKKLPPALPPA